MDGDGRAGGGGSPTRRAGAARGRARTSGDDHDDDRGHDALLAPGEREQSARRSPSRRNDQPDRAPTANRYTEPHEEPRPWRAGPSSRTARLARTPTARGTTAAIAAASDARARRRAKAAATGVGRRRRGSRSSTCPPRRPGPGDRTNRAADRANHGGQQERPDRRSAGLRDGGWGSRLHEALTVGDGVGEQVVREPVAHDEVVAVRRDVSEAEGQAGDDDDRQRATETSGAAGYEPGVGQGSRAPTRHHGSTLARRSGDRGERYSATNGAGVATERSGSIGG